MQSTTAVLCGLRKRIKTVLHDGGPMYLRAPLIDHVAQRCRNSCKLTVVHHVR